MIRFASVLFCALFALSAYATPKVGDYAAFDLTITTSSGQTAQGTLEREITQNNGTQFLERQVVTVAGQAPQTSENWQDASNFLDDSTIDAILGNCAAAGGNPQTISVPAGSYTTCAIDFDNNESKGTVWVGKVSLGVVRIDSFDKANSVTVSGLLRSFR
jgi:hypothetical protein